MTLSKTTSQDLKMSLILMNMATAMRKQKPLLILAGTYYDYKKNRLRTA